MALVPVLLFLAALVQGDSFKLVRLRTVLMLVAVGAGAAGVSYAVNRYAYPQFGIGFDAYSDFVSPWIEECSKAAVLVFLIRTRRIGLPVDAAISGFAIGTGFALIENLYYLGSRPETVLGVQVIRGFGTALMHGGTTTVLAILSVTLYERRPNGGLVLLLPGILAAVALHSGYNLLLVKPALAALAMLLVLPFSIHLVFSHSERALRDWLDEDLDSKVKLLELVNSGTFLDSPLGRTLDSLRHRFRGKIWPTCCACCDCMPNSRYARKGCCCFAKAGWRTFRSTMKRGTNWRNLRNWNAPSVQPECSRCAR